MRTARKTGIDEEIGQRSNIHWTVSGLADIRRGETNAGANVVLSYVVFFLERLEAIAARQVSLFLHSKTWLHGCAVIGY